MLQTNKVFDTQDVDTTPEQSVADIFQKQIKVLLKICLVFDFYTSSSAAFKIIARFHSTPILLVGFLQVNL